MNRHDLRILASTRDVTLDGARAVIVGWSLPFLAVASLELGIRVEYSDESIRRVLESGGAFRS
jgi:hypothetical protein